MNEILINEASVINLAYSNAEYTPETMVTAADIYVAERSYLAPVVGEAMMEALRGGAYESLLNNYIALPLALYTREVANLPTAPRSVEGRRRARAAMVRLSDYLDENSGDYPEYDPANNVLKRCKINGTHIQIR